ncbi:MAG: polyphosphate kinase 2 family protein [Nitrososphaerales archaeon]
MTPKLHENKFLVKPGKDISLKHWDPSDTSAFDGNELAAKEESKKINSKLDQLQEMLYAENKHKLLIILQAMDTGGKDGVIRRVFEGVNPSGVRVVHFRTPSQDELDHGFLWRAYAQIPSRGELVIFNRSHYEAVLIERVHNLVPDEIWQQRYKEICEFEELLHEEGTTILKFYLHISSDEQKKRLKARLSDPTKEWKFSQNDLVERKLWHEYMKAYEHVLRKTSTKSAPWYIIPSNHKWFRDLAVARIIVKTLEGFNMQFPAISNDMKAVKIP